MSDDFHTCESDLSVSHISSTDEDFEPLSGISEAVESCTDEFNTNPLYVQLLNPWFPVNLSKNKTQIKIGIAGVYGSEFIISSTVLALDSKNTVKTKSSRYYVGLENCLSDSQSIYTKYSMHLIRENYLVDEVFIYLTKYGFTSSWITDLTEICCRLNVSLVLRPQIPSTVSTPPTVRRPFQKKVKWDEFLTEKDTEEARKIASMRKSAKKSQLGRKFAKRMEELERSKQDPSVLVETPLNPQRRNISSSDSALIQTICDSIETTPVNQKRERTFIPLELEAESPQFVLSPSKSNIITQGVQKAMNRKRRSGLVTVKNATIMKSSPKRKVVVLEVESKDDFEESSDQDDIYE
ncbi:hypothetical protein P9112_008774 [Eukaryota sp. TZLM1-RC]